jgi:hypothetical protein
MEFETMLKAIETKYKGCRFRSRLEARWAVFFDAIGIEWEYEKEGYKLPSGWYLPDFWLPETKTWVEVKPELPTWRPQKIYLAGKCGYWRENAKTLIKYDTVIGPNIKNLHDTNHGYETEYPDFIFNAATNMIEDCDILLAWINALDCYGTIFEIGYANAIGKKIFIAYDSSLDIPKSNTQFLDTWNHGEPENSDFWFVNESTGLTGTFLTVDSATRWMLSVINNDPPIEIKKLNELSTISMNSTIMVASIGLGCKFMFVNSIHSNICECLNRDKNKIDSAIIKACSARFEYGEQG